jgi:NADH-quinone oxidoreductase subunit N
MSPSLSETLLVLTPELLICVMAVVILVYGAFAKAQGIRPAILLAALALIASVCLLVDRQADALLLFKDMFALTPLTHFAKILLLGAALMALILSSKWLQQPQRRQFEYPVLLLLATFGLMLLISANDFLALYMALELASLALYVMAAFDRDDGYSSEAGLKYFILGSLASGMMLFGISLIYGFSGTTNFALLADLFAVDAYQLNAGLAVGLVLLLVGLCFKISAVPFHMWTPDVYEGAPTPVVAFFAVAPKVAALVLLARILHEVFGDLGEHWQPIIYVVSVGSMLVGAFGALKQMELKRLLAYSSIGHVGFMLMGVLIGGEAGLQAMLIYLALYVFMSIGAFGFVMALQRGGLPVTRIEALGGLSKNCASSAMFMALIMFSMAGIPPLAGFFGKFYVLMAAIEAEYYWLVALGLFSSVVSAYYYLKIVKVMYFDEAKAPFDKGALSLSAKALLALCALVTGFFFLFPTHLLEITAQAVRLF